MFIDSGFLSIVVDSNPTEPFRLLDLPAELRVQIYRNLLCNFELRLPEEDELSQAQQFPSQPPKLSRSTDAAILRTCRKVYKEAYHEVVTAHRFVQVHAGDGVPARSVLSEAFIAVVSFNDGFVQQFKDCSMTVDMRMKPNRPLLMTVEEDTIPMTPCSFLLLH
ncbi:hypothetical protein F5Y15DRAFT_419265 [Xylariaceae sp. FL0016]|nr:hypothetical protein F5Y15DRAFT_419265 [Xylariaceae sp. FL0016]